MVRSRQHAIERLLADAEHNASCLAVTDPAMRKSLMRLVNKGSVVCPAQSVYARTDYWNALTKSQQHIHMLRALQTLHPDWVFCHGSAGVVFGLPLSYAAIEKVHIATSKERRNRSGDSVSRHVMPSGDFVIINGIRVTTLERTAFDCMRTADFCRALAIADAALRLDRAHEHRFATFFKMTGRHCPGARHAMRTLLYADARSESAGESIARAAMIEGGFALPDLQVELPRPMEKGRVYRPDFRWMREDGTYVLGEFDGVTKYTDPLLRNGRTAVEAFAEERRRESQLSLYGMPIVRFGWKDVVNRTAFYRLLHRFGVPQSAAIAEEVRDLARSRTASAKTFCYVPW